jgi:hypothetical protein
LKYSSKKAIGGLGTFILASISIHLVGEAIKAEPLILVACHRLGKKGKPRYNEG